MCIFVAPGEQKVKGTETLFEENMAKTVTKKKTYRSLQKTYRSTQRFKNSMKIDTKKRSYSKCLNEKRQKILEVSREK